MLRLCAPTTILVLPSSAMRRAEMITTKGPRGTKQNLIPCVPTWLCSRKAMGNREPLAQLGQRGTTQNLIPCVPAWLCSRKAMGNFEPLAQLVQRGQAGIAITSCMPLPHVAPAHNHTGAGRAGNNLPPKLGRVNGHRAYQRPSRTIAAQFTIRDNPMSAGAGLHNALNVHSPLRFVDVRTCTDPAALAVYGLFAAK